MEVVEVAEFFTIGVWGKGWYYGKDKVGKYSLKYQIRVKSYVA